MPDGLLRLYLTLHGALLRLRDALADERGDVPGWVLITGMTVALVMAIWGVAQDALRNLIRDFLSGISFD
jgi:hypothetical protein